MDQLDNFELNEGEDKFQRSQVSIAQDLCTES